MAYLWKQVFLSAALTQACLACSVCDLHTGCMWNCISSGAGGEEQSATKEDVESMFENTVTAGVGFFVLYTYWR